MTREELLSTPQYLDKIDIMTIFGCCKDRAYAIIRGIKSVSDIAGLTGKVTMTDYERWSAVIRAPKEESRLPQNPYRQ